MAKKRALSTKRPRRNSSGDEDHPNPIDEVVSIFDTFAAVGRICGVSGKAVERWKKNGRLPRTEATGETNYSQLLADADPRVDKNKLLSTVMRNAP